MLLTMSRSITKATRNFSLKCYMFVTINFGALAQIVEHIFAVARNQQQFSTENNERHNNETATTKFNEQIHGQYLINKAILHKFYYCLDIPH